MSNDIIRLVNSKNVAVGLLISFLELRLLSNIFHILLYWHVYPKGLHMTCTMMCSDENNFNIINLRKRRLRYYGDVKRKKPSRLINQIFEFYENRNNPKTEVIKWISAMKGDIAAVIFTQADITYQSFRHNVFIEKLVRGKELEDRNSLVWREDKNPFRENETMLWVQRLANISRRWWGVFRVMRSGPYVNNTLTLVVIEFLR